MCLCVGAERVGGGAGGRGKKKESSVIYVIWIKLCILPPRKDFTQLSKIYSPETSYFQNDIA